MEATEYVASLIEKSRKAQQVIDGYNQEQVDECVRVIGKVIYDHSYELAKFAVEETRMGVVADKDVKNKRKALSTWGRLKGVKSVGVMNYIEERGIVEVGKPIGVVGAVTPTTNPIITPMNNAMLALKGRNSIIICPHPRAKKCGKLTVDYMREALKEIGAPEDLILIVEEPTVEISGLIMKMCDVCVSTGGPGMVKAAYSSGKPAYGVGAGNVQCLIDRDADFEKVLPMAMEGRAFDNGILCTCEQCVIIPNDKREEIISIMEKNGARYVCDEAEVKKVRDLLFPDGVLNRDCVGMPPKEIAEKAGISAPDDVKVIAVKIDKSDVNEPLCREKMFPVMGVFGYDTWDEAVKTAVSNLSIEGAGHSCVIHSNNKEDIEYAAERLPVSRILINQKGSAGLGGTFDNGLAPTATLGCGSWGNNSISDNLNFRNLMNISHVAYQIPNNMPSDDIIWQSK